MDVFSFEVGSSSRYLVGIGFCKDICFQTLPGRGGRQAEGAWASPGVPCMQSRLRLGLV